MDIKSLSSVNAPIIKEMSESIYKADSAKRGEGQDVFQALLNSAMDNINTTNDYFADARNEEIKLAMGETDTTHDLSIALQKASTALQYTVAVRDKFLEAYKEIMQMQV